MNEYAERALSQLEGQHDKVFKLVLDNRFIKELIIALNTDEQLGKEHVDSLNNQLFSNVTNRGTYSIFDKKGRGGKAYTLNDTGAFWDSWKVTVRSGNFTIDADPFKEETNLFDEYGIDILGLTEESLQVLINESLEKYINWFERNILPR